MLEDEAQAAAEVHLDELGFVQIGGTSITVEAGEEKDSTGRAFIEIVGQKGSKKVAIYDENNGKYNDPMDTMKAVKKSAEALLPSRGLNR